MWSKDLLQCDARLHVTMPSFWLHPRVECRDALQWQWSDALIPGKRIRSVDVWLQHSQPGLQLQHSLQCECTAWLYDCLTVWLLQGNLTNTSCHQPLHSLRLICGGGGTHWRFIQKSVRGPLTTHTAWGAQNQWGPLFELFFFKDECNVVDIEWLPSFFRINYAQRIASVGGGCRLPSVQN